MGIRVYRRYHLFATCQCHSTRVSKALTVLLISSLLSQFQAGVQAGSLPSSAALSSPSHASSQSDTRLSQQPARSPVSPASAAPLIQQGTQLSLNGRVLPGIWGQWETGSGNTRQVHIGVLDAALVQTIGTELFNTTDVSRQPIQWFSQPATAPLLLPTRFTGQYRLLNIRDLAQQAGWQVQPDGNLLRISSPAANVIAIRQGKQPWGDRIVINLDRSTPWQTNRLTGELVVKIDATVNPTLLQSFKSIPTAQLQSLKIESAANQTVLHFGIANTLSPYVWTLPNPDRLVIDLRPDFAPDRNIQWAPGIQWRQQVFSIGTSRVPVVWLTISPRQAGLSLKPIWSSPAGMTGTAPLFQTAQRNQVAAAINGGFFNRNNQLPLGAIRRDGRWLSGPILNRGAIAWNENGEFRFDRLSLQESLTTSSGQRFPILSLNSAYVQAGIARYTSDWGATYTPLADNETLISVENNRITNQQSGGITATTTPVSIPLNGYLLVVRANQAAISALNVGSTVSLETSTIPSDFARYPYVIGAGPLLLQNRQIVLDAKSEKFSDAFIREMAARSAIGRTAEGTILIVAVPDRTTEGLTLAELAQLMQQLGATDALNLDGGSSTTLYLGGQLLDRLPQNAARVHNGIGVFLQPRL